MPRVCPHDASDASTFPGLDPPENFDPAEPRAWRRHREHIYEEVRMSSGLYAASSCTTMKFSSGRGRH